MHDKPLRILAAPAVLKTSPYFTLLYSNIRKQGCTVTRFRELKALSGKYQIIHIHWPEHFLGVNNSFFPAALLRTLLRLTVLAFAKLRGAKIVWTMHNLVSHERRRPWYEDLVTPLFISLVDGITCMSAKSKELLIERYSGSKNKRIFIIPHGHYKGWYGGKWKFDGARDALGLPHEKVVLLYFGTIKEYKNVPALIKIFRQLGASKYELVVAGACKESPLKNEIENLATGIENIRLYLRYIEDDEIPLFLGAADIVVLPFTEILNSGSVILALSYDRRVVTTHSDALEELQAVVGSNNLVFLKSMVSAESLEKMLSDMLSHETTSINLSGLEWEKIARDTITCYQAILSRNKQIDV